MTTKILKCIQCGVEFEAARSTAKFHSDVCRVLYSRKKEQTPTLNPETLSKAIEVLKTAVPDKIEGAHVIVVEDEMLEPVSSVVKTGVSKRTGLSYDMTEKPQWGPFVKQLCSICKEPTWCPPCSACCDDLRKKQ